MVNLRAIANSATSRINPNVLAVARRYTGFVTNLNGISVPNYIDTPVIVQVQALSYTDITMLDGMNIQGVRRSIYTNGVISGIIRVAQKGGDLIIFPTGMMPEGDTWLAALVLEAWPDWTHVAITLQDGS